MAIYKKEFEGVATEDGDDSNCWGIHFSLGDGGSPDEPIGWLDDIIKHVEGKKVKVTITVEELP